MKNLLEKRELATAWINNAPEAEIDVLSQTVL